MNKFLLYGHGGSYNHGAEAIVRTTIQMIRSKYPNAHIVLSSHFPEQDREFALDADAIFGPDETLWALEKKATGFQERRELARAMYTEALGQITGDMVCLSVGGDVFCYKNWHRLAVFQEKAVEVGAKTILWGCSVEPSAITPEMLKVLRSYTYIIARESITYDALCQHGLSDKLTLAPDPAFVLEPKPFALPKGLLSNPIVGINISPLIVRQESRPGILVDNIRLLIKYITTKTGFSVLLIPHVVTPADNDYALLANLYSELTDEEKQQTYLLGNEYSAAEYKYAIAQCRFLVCVRTHASIAAYSLGIPTLVLGYSVKAKGIARDLDMDNYVLDITEIMRECVSTEAFLQLQNDYERISTNLKNRNYIIDIGRALELL